MWSTGPVFVPLAGESSRSNLCYACYRMRICLLAFYLALLSGGPCLAQTVDIRLLNTVSGSPVSNRRILVFDTSGNADTPEKDEYKLFEKDANPDLRLISNANGEAKFDLPQPAPASFYVLAELSGPVWDCDCLVRVVTNDLMSEGREVSNAAEERKPGKLQTQLMPGEILFRLRSLPFWVRFFWPLAKR